MIEFSSKRCSTFKKQYKDTSEAAIAGVKIIADCCLRSQTVKKLIYTASVMASSSLKNDGSGFESCWDESCWTTLNDIPFNYCSDYVRVFVPQFFSSLLATNTLATA